MFSEKAQVPVPLPGPVCASKTEVNDAIGSGCYSINLTNRQPIRRSPRYRDEKQGMPGAASPFIGNLCTREYSLTDGIAIKVLTIQISNYNGPNLAFEGILQ